MRMLPLLLWRLQGALVLATTVHNKPAALLHTHVPHHTTACHALPGMAAPCIAACAHAWFIAAWCIAPCHHAAPGTCWLHAAGVLYA